MGGAFIVNTTHVTVGDAKFTLFRLKNTLGALSDKNKITLHCHLFYEIKLVYKGIYDYAFKDGSVTVSEGEMLVVPPNEYHYTRPADSVYGEYVLSLTLEKTEGKEKVYGSFKKALCDKSCVAVKTTKELEKSVEEYLSFPCECPTESVMGLCREHQLASRVIYELSKCILPDGDKEKNTDIGEASNKGSDASILLELVNCSTSVTLAEIAYRMGYSAKHVARIIKEQFGMTYGELIRTRRLESAKKLLSDTDIPINEVSERTGYRTPSALYRDMKKYEGITPTRYRKENSKISK